MRLTLNRIAYFSTGYFIGKNFGPSIELFLNKINTNNIVTTV